MEGFEIKLERLVNSIEHRIFASIKSLFIKIDFFKSIEQIKDIVNRDICLMDYEKEFKGDDLS